jgi:Domain of unknown function (DUF4381)
MSNTASEAAANAERINKALQTLHDIAEPVTPAFWPPAPGWYFVFVAVLLLIALAAVRSWRRWQAGAYRRQALRELAALRDSAHSISPQQRIGALATLLRRVALYGAPRENLASLSGDAWIDYLSKHSKHSMARPNDGVAKLLSLGPYAKLAADEQGGKSQRDDMDAAFAYVAEWIAQHRIPAGRGA